MPDKQEAVQRQQDAEDKGELAQRAATVLSRPGPHQHLQSRLFAHGVGEGEGEGVGEGPAEGRIYMTRGI